MTDITIRSWRTEDGPGIRALHDRTPPFPGLALDEPPPWPTDLDDIAANFLTFFVAESEVHIVGMVGVIEIADDISGELLAQLPEPSRVVQIMRMRVAPERQRQGIGSQLLEAAVAWAHAHGRTHMILDTTSRQEHAIALYASCGFTEITRSTLGRWTLVWMLRDLRSANASI